MTRYWNSDNRNSKNKRFGTVDGEGGNIPDRHALFGTTHEYLLLRADEFEVGSGDPLGYRECFDFLAGLPRNRIWTGYFFDYDVTMMCRGLPEERARRLFDPTERLRTDGFSYRYIEVDNTWEIGYIPHKEFICRRIGQPNFTVVSDTGSFFQTRFTKSLEKWNIGTEEERKNIQLGKDARADFAELTQNTRDYNELECVLHDELMEEFRTVCVETGYVPTKWQGPGHLASAMLKKHGVPRREEIPIMGNWQFRELANAAYYGGRAETTAIGHIEGPIFQWDINGAYVSALRSLPCLRHGSWKHVREVPRGNSVWVGNVEFGNPPNRMLYNLPVRKSDGNIFFPRFGTGHYWSWELAAAYRAGTRYKYIDGWVYEKHCDCKPFAWVDAYYAERLRVGKSGRGIVLKLGGNSIYGKLAQSIGYAPWANPVWAGLITAYCRAKIIDAYANNPDDVLMIMTDGIFMRHDPGLPQSTKLGEWELKVHDNLFIVQPGIYFLPGGTVKTRGVPLGRIQAVEEVFRERFAKFATDYIVPEPVSVPVTNFLTMRQALARRKWHIAGTWEKTTRDISYEWTNKRAGAGLIRERDTGTIRTLPVDSDYNVISQPYDRIIGGQMNISPFKQFKDDALANRREEGEQPDWNSPLFDDDE